MGRAPSEKETAPCRGGRVWETQPPRKMRGTKNPIDAGSRCDTRLANKKPVLTGASRLTQGFQGTFGADFAISHSLSERGHSARPSLPRDHGLGGMAS